MCGHVDDVITSCAQSIQAMRILRAHGMAASTIHVIFSAVVVAKLTYAASSWLGFTTDEDRQRLAAVIRRCIRSGLCDPDHMSQEDLVTDADDKHFHLILYSKHHVLHSILPDRSDFNYNLRPRHHNLVLTAKSSSMTDRDYIIRMVFKNIYWCWHIHLLLFSLAVYMFRFR